MQICKECKKEKQLSEYYKHPLTKSGYMWKCISCVIAWRKTEHEMAMARVRDKKRYNENPRRRLYTIWKNLNRRCYDPSDSHFKRYWARWVKVEWESFQKFYDDTVEMYLAYININWKDRKSCQFDRINNDWNYCKWNCRFITAKQNNPHNRFKNENIHF